MQAHKNKHDRSCQLINGFRTWQIPVLSHIGTSLVQSSVDVHTDTDTISGHVVLLTLSHITLLRLVKLRLATLKLVCSPENYGSVPLTS